MYKNFILSYDPISTKFTLNQLNAFIRSNGGTHQYYAPFLGTVMIKSASTLSQLIESYRGFFDGDQFFLAEFPSQNTGGLLPRYAWDWVNSTTPPPLVDQSN